MRTLSEYEKTNTVWLIDPGQSISINKEEFATGELILNLLSRMANIEDVRQALNRSMINPHPGHEFFTSVELTSLMRISEPRDAFIKFIALTEEKGGHLSLSTIQWVFGMYRQLALARKTGVPMERRLLQRQATQLLRQGEYRKTWNLLRSAIGW